MAKKTQASKQGHNKPRISGGEVLKLVSDAIAFSRVSWLAKEEIKKLGADQVDYHKPIHGDHGWPAGSVWESLQTVCHFNLATSLELTLKALIRLDRPERQQRGPHRLSVLYDRLIPSTRNRLEAAWNMIDKSIPIELVAYVEADRRPDPPRQSSFNSLRDWFAYFDTDLQMHTKRYSWENLAKGEYRQYIMDLRPFYDVFEILRVLVVDRARGTGILLPDSRSDEWKKSLDFLSNSLVDLDSFYEKSGWHKDGNGQWTKLRLDGERVLVHRPDVFWKMLITEGENYLTVETGRAWSSTRNLDSGKYTDPVLVAELMADVTK